jgi:hypothetical protein
MTVDETTIPRRAEPDRILMFAPLVYVAWADGVLTDDERAGVHAAVTGRVGLSEEAP